MKTKHDPSGKVIEISGAVMRLVILQMVAGALALAGASVRAQEGKETGQDGGKPVVSTTAESRVRACRRREVRHCMGYAP